MNRYSIIVRWILRILIAAVFVFSAVSKFIGIDQFELYIFSFGFFPLNCCFLLARLCIGAELVLALFTLCGWFPRTMRLATSGLLILFTLFLCYAALVGRNDNCHCFGEMVDLNPLQSLLKNAVLLAMVLAYYRLTPPKRRMHIRWVAFPVVLALALMAAPFISIPDNWSFGPQKQPYNAPALAQWYDTYVKPSRHQNHFIAAFVTPQCHYCKLARKKLDAIASRHNISADQLLYVEPQLKENTPEAVAIPRDLFLDITYGSRPLVFLLADTHVVATYHLRNIDEDQIVEFLK